MCGVREAALLCVSRRPPGGRHQSYQSRSSSTGHAFGCWHAYGVRDFTRDCEGLLRSRKHINTARPCLVPYCSGKPEYLGLSVSETIYQAFLDGQVCSQSHSLRWGLGFPGLWRVQELELLQGLWSLQGLWRVTGMWLVQGLFSVQSLWWMQVLRAQANWCEVWSFMAFGHRATISRWLCTGGMSCRS